MKISQRANDGSRPILFTHLLAVANPHRYGACSVTGDDL
jgi:hypothetical protein